MYIYMYKYIYTYIYIYYRIHTTIESTSDPVALTDRSTLVYIYIYIQLCEQVYKLLRYIYICLYTYIYILLDHHLYNGPFLQKLGDHPTGELLSALDPVLRASVCRSVP